jgi:hypothetical protein
MFSYACCDFPASSNFVTEGLKGRMNRLFASVSGQIGKCKAGVSSDHPCCIGPNQAPGWWVEGGRRDPRQYLRVKESAMSS